MHEQIVIALLVEAGVDMPAILGLAEPVVLDHRAERAVGHEDALGGFGAEAIGDWCHVHISTCAERSRGTPSSEAEKPR